MKNNVLYIITSIALFLIPLTNFGQPPNMGTTVDFVLFSSDGAVSNTGITHLTGNVGTNNGSSTAFGNVNGQMHDNDAVTAQAAADLLVAYDDLNAATPTFFPAALLGNGAILSQGVYSISSAATLNLDLILDGGGDPNAVFIFQIDGAFSTNANSKVKLINSAKACNVFWKIEGLVDMAAGTTMRGSVIANNAAINMNVGDTLEGRLLAIAGAITVDGVLGDIPIGCGSPTLTGPMAPDLLSTSCYGVFSGDGPVSNAGITYVTGDVGTNVGLTTGYNALFVTGSIHAVPDGSTASAAADLINIYDYLNLLPSDIELLYPPQFGNNLVLTPHTYVMNGAVTFTDTLFLNAQGNANAVFVIQVNGAFSTSTYSKVVLMNGAKAENVFWKIDGAVEINDYSIFEGTIVCNNGAIGINTGVLLNGRAMTTSGAVGTVAISTTLPLGCATTYAPMIVSNPVNDSLCPGSNASYTVIATGTALTYQWRRGTTDLVNGGNISGANSATIVISNTITSDFVNDYNVVVSGTGGPNVTSTDAAMIICADLGITEEGKKEIASVYPNPFNNSLSIFLKDATSNDFAQITIYNLMGVEIFNQPITEQLTILETAAFPAGIYTYQIFNSIGVLQTGKLISVK